MCRWLVLFLVLWNTISLQPVTGESENVRQSRQLDFECCPCTGPRAGLRDLPSDLRPDSRTTGVDDCPCRVRDDDSQGSPSIFLPRAVRPLRPVLKLSDSKEDHKPLLHPEVDFASSVLETLREVTDEEYKEAVARDAARSSAVSPDPDVFIRDSTPETAKNIVTIILNSKPEEDVLVSDASDVQETHFIKPSGSPIDSIEQVRLTKPQALLKEIFNLPKLESQRRLHSVEDMDSSASNVQEHVNDNMNKGIQGLTLRTKSFDKIQNGSSESRDSDESCKILDKKLNTNIPVFRFNENTNVKNSERGEINKTFTNSLISILRPHTIQRLEGKFDNSVSSNSVLGQLFKRTNQQTPISRLKAFMPASDIHNTRKQFGIKNLLKLRDIELIPPKLNNAKITMPSIKLTAPTRSSKIETDLNSSSNERRSDSFNIDNCEEETEESKMTPNINLDTNDKSVTTQILDAVPSPSENHETVTATNDNLETSGDQLDESIMSEKPVRTEILDTVPSPSETHQISVVNKDNLNKISDQLDEDPINAIDLTDSASGFNSEEIDAIRKSPEDGAEINDFNDSNVNNIIVEDDVPDTDKVIENTQINLADIMSGVNSNELVIIDSFENGDLNQDSATDIAQTVSQEGSETNNADLVLDSESETNGDTLISLIVDNNDEDPSLGNNFRSEESYRNDNQADSKTDTASKTFTENVESNTNTEMPTQFEGTYQSDERSLRSGNNDNIIDYKEKPVISNLAPSISTREESQKSTRMSNYVLDLSNSKSQNYQDIKTLKCEPQEDLRLSESSPITLQHAQVVNISDEATESNIDLQSSATSPQTKVLDTLSNPIASSEKLSQDSIQNNSKQENNSFTNMIDTSGSTQALGKECWTTSNLDQKNDEIRDKNVQPAEMTAEASAPIINTVPQTTSKAFKDLRSSSLQDIVVQPSSLFGGNDLFRRPFPGIGTVFTTKTQLPTLNEIQSSISNMLTGKDRHADEKEISSTESDNTNDCSNSNPIMSTDSSTTNSKMIFPQRNPLENINVDIFQISPITRSRIPSLNLNSYKAKLAIPKSLDLKPIKLQSSLGRNGGLLGATLTFGPDKTGYVRNNKPSSILNRKGSDILKSRLGTMTGLDGLRSTIKTNTENLLKSPLTMPGTYLHSGQISALSDNLKYHTANTMKNIQQTLASTMNEAAVKGDKFAKPQDLLEMVSTAHDDVTDKLQAIHSDLTDRLTSLHETIVDQSNLPSLQTPVLKQMRNFNKNPQIRPNSVFKVSQNNHSPKSEAYKSNSQNGKLGSTQARTYVEQNKFKPYKISNAASTLTPKSVEVPKLTTTSTKPPFLRPLQRDINVKLKENKQLNVEKESMKSQNIKPVWNKLKPFGESKVKVSISTTVRPLTVKNLKTKPMSTTPKSIFDSKAIKLQAAPKWEQVRNKNKPVTLSQNLRLLTDSNGFASDIKPTVIPSPLIPFGQVKSGNTDANALKANVRSSQLRQNPGITEGTKPKPPLLNQSTGSSGTQLTTGSFKPKAPSISDVTVSATNNEPSARNIKSPPPVWPKVNDPVFLSKVREALKARFSNLNAGKPNGKVRTNAKVQPLGSGDMIRSASENTEVVSVDEKLLKMRTNAKVQQLGSDDMIRSASENTEVVSVDENPLKENVSYRCKMVCVREPTEP